MEYTLKDRAEIKAIFFIFTIILLFVFVITANSNINFLLQNRNSEIYNNYVPLEDTFNKLGFKVVSKDNNYIEFNNGLQSINFVSEDNFNIKKNDNTYYSKVIGDTAFIKIAVLEDLGYKVNDNYCLNNNIKLDTNLFSEILSNNFTLTDERDLPESKMFYCRNIIKSITEKELKDYSIENVNLMNYNIEELKDYINANYKTSLKQYKNNLVSINTKYPYNSRVTYDLLDNGQVKADINTPDGNRYIELAVEIRNGEIFLEK